MPGRKFSASDVVARHQPAQQRDAVGLLEVDADALLRQVVAQEGRADRRGRRRRGSRAPPRGPDSPSRGCSTFTTSAPRCASSCVAKGIACSCSTREHADACRAAAAGGRLARRPSYNGRPAQEHRVIYDPYSRRVPGRSRTRSTATSATPSPAPTTRRWTSTRSSASRTSGRPRSTGRPTARRSAPRSRTAASSRAS